MMHAEFTNASGLGGGRVAAALLGLVLLAGLACGQPDSARKRSSVGSAQEIEEGLIIKKIEIIGNKRVTDAAIKAKLLTREGAPFSSAKLSKDIKALSESDGYFIHVDVDHVVLPDKKLILRFRVKEMNYVERVRCLGVVNEELKDVLEEVKIEAGRFVNQYEIDLKSRQLETWYRKKGYQYVQVRARTQPGRSGGTDVVFLVNEGPRVKVDRIVFRGNKSLTDSELLAPMQTETSGIFSKGIYDRELIEADCIRLQEYYRERGFKDAKVNLVDVLENEDFSRVTLVIRIDEGEPYIVEGIEIEGNHLFTDEELLGRMKQRPGQRYDILNIVQDVKALVDRYREQAYLDVRFLDRDGPKQVYRLDGPRVKLVYRISEGEKIRLGQIRLIGNEITRDKVILRELTLAPGDWVDIREVERSIARLRALGYFEPGVGIQGPIWKETGNKNVKDLVLRFREGHTGHLRVAVGVGSDSGLSGLLSVTKENFDIADLPRSFESIFTGGAFSGGGQTLILSVAPGTRISNFQVQFIEPRIFSTPWSLNTSIFAHRRIFETYETDRTGARLTIGRRLDRDLDIRDIFNSQSTLRWEIVDLKDSTSDVDVTVPPPPLRVPTTMRINSFEQRFTYRSWDDPLLTTRGWEAVVSGQLAGGPFGGTENFLKTVATAEFGIPIYTTENRKIHVFGVRGQVGWAQEYGDSLFVPLVERFFIGGSETLRGFNFHGVGPRDRNGDVTGGQVMWATSVEYRFPLVQRFLRGLVFWDSGALANRVSGPEFDLVRMSVGFGFRITVPFLGPRPFAIDFGFPIRSEPLDEDRLVSLTIGRVFY